MRSAQLVIVTMSAAVIACEQPVQPHLVQHVSAVANDVDDDGDVKLQGEGTVDLTTANAGFMSYSYHLRADDGTVKGEFWQYRETALGTVEFTGQVTCLVADPVNRRAWVGGIILENRSTSPAFRVDTLHQPGMDIWFRVVDYSDATPPQADRSTVFGFKGSAGIKTSADYCAIKPWPGPPTDPRDARTFPVSDGYITLKTKD